MENNTIERPFHRGGNAAYKERFQFMLSVNDNIICQRYFKINGFISDSLYSVELKDTLDYCVTLIQNDLKSKSRVYLHYNTITPVQMTGFNGDTEKTYLVYPKTEENNYREDEELNPYDVTFKFEFIIDNRPVYTYIWDGTQYPKYVRNSVDLTNSNSMYRDRDPLMLNFTQCLSRAMTSGKNDLTYQIIKRICAATSGNPSEVEYTRSEMYDTTEGHVDENGKFRNDRIIDSVEYQYNPYNKKYVNDWRKYTMKKSIEYFGGSIPSNKQ